MPYRQPKDRPLKHPPGWSEWRRAGWFWFKAREAKKRGDLEAYRKARKQWIRWRVAALAEGFLPARTRDRILAAEERYVIARSEKWLAAKQRGDAEEVRRLDEDAARTSARAARRAAWDEQAPLREASSWVSESRGNTMGMMGVAMSYDDEGPDPEYGE